MGGVYEVKANLLAGFGVNPAIIRKTATRKRDGMRPFGVDNREFQIAVERCGIYELPFHDARSSSITLIDVCDRNHGSEYSLVNNELDTRTDFESKAAFIADCRDRVRAEDRYAR
jgi:hypothetical protein